MFISTGDKSILLDYMGKGILPMNGESKLPSTPPPPDKIYLVWETRPEAASGTLPSFLVFPDGYGRDFLAWSATFIGTVKPFTAFVRVLEWSTAKIFFDSFIPSETSITSVSVIGLIIGEALARNKIYYPNNLTIAQCKSTASYAMAKVFALGLSPLGLDAVISKYHKVFKNNTIEYPSISNDDIYPIWEIAKRLLLMDEKASNNNWNILANNKLNNKPSIVQYYLDYMLSACHEITANGDISRTTWDRISNNSFEYDEMKKEMESTMERRIVFFEKVISSSVIRAVEVPLAKGFIAAYLAFKINPGLMSHCKLLGTFSNEHPSAMIWYGFISGIYSKSELLGSFDCLGRRIARDISRRVDIFDHPTCDISIEEMDVLSSGENPLTYYKKFADSSIEIELFPHISINYPVQVPNSDSAKPNNVSTYDNKLLVELGESLRRSNELFSKIRYNVATNQEPTSYPKKEQASYPKKEQASYPKKEQASYPVRELDRYPKVDSESYDSRPNYYPSNNNRTVVAETKKVSKSANISKKKQNETEDSLFLPIKDDSRET